LGFSKSSIVDLRAAYSGYMIDPCNKSDWYTDTMTAIIENQGKLAELKIRLKNAIGEFSTGQSVDDAKLGQVLQDTKEELVRRTSIILQLAFCEGLYLNIFDLNVLYVGFPSKLRPIFTVLPSNFNTFLDFSTANAKPPLC
jgi:hypothetical protein